MPVCARNLQDVGKNIKVGFCNKENTETQTLLENSISDSWKFIEYTWNLYRNPARTGKMAKIN